METPSNIRPDQDPRNRFVDPVEAWKALVRARFGSEASAAPGRPRIELRVHLSFVALSILWGVPLGLRGVMLVPAALLSILLVQELPRALVLRSLRRSSTVVISATGGRTESAGPPLRGMALGAFQVAGSIANAIAALLLLFAGRRAGAAREGELLQALALWHALWALMQVMPVLSFRAGEAVHRNLRASARLAHASASLVFAVVLGLLLGRAAPAVFPLLALAAAGALSALGPAYRDSVDERLGTGAVAASADALLARGAPERALEVARDALGRAQGTQLRARLWRALAWSAIGVGDPILAHQALGELPPSAIDLHLVAAYLSTCNRLDEAIALLEEARALGHRSAETTKLLVDLRYRSGDSRLALATARADAALLSKDELAAVERAVAS